MNICLAISNLGHYDNFNGNSYFHEKALNSTAASEIQTIGLESVFGFGFAKLQPLYDKTSAMIRTPSHLIKFV